MGPGMVWEESLVTVVVEIYQRFRKENENKGKTGMIIMTERGI